ncbi:MAG: elongation factor [Rickettsiales bacterium]|jgi:elongation factor P|nr:elongation factor [Rickettsiales bacterium]
MAFTNANSIRVGNIIEHNKRLCAVVRTAHTMPGKGGAFVQMELRDIKTGTKLNERFRSSENVDRVRLDQKDYQYLYTEGDLLTLMDQETFEQVQFSQELVGDAVVFLQDGMMVLVESYEGDPVSIELPELVTLTVQDTEAVVKGQTAASSYKPAIMDNGVRVMVPPFIETGTRIVVRTTDITYMERAKD